MTDFDPRSFKQTGEPTLHAKRDAPLEHAAALLAESVESLLLEQGEIHIAIPGGSAMQSALLLKTRLGEAWRRLRLTWIDERCVATEDPESNYGAALRAGLQEGPMAARILPLFQTGESPGEAVHRVSDQLVSGFSGRLDLLLLGMGEDGHIASIFPASSPNHAPPIHDRRPCPTTPEAWVEYISESPKPPPNRITLTRPFLGIARRSVLVALGEAKRAPIERLLDGDTRLPAYGLSDLHIVTDLSFPPCP